jgi:hypothetical protein
MPARLILSPKKTSSMCRVRALFTPLVDLNAIRPEARNVANIWEECIQEETRVANREALLARDEYQALATHTKGGRKKYHFQKETHKESHPQKKSQPKRFHKKGQRKERD